jgi:hypothetical protein
MSKATDFIGKIGYMEQCIPKSKYFKLTWIQKSGRVKTEKFNTEEEMLKRFEKLEAQGVDTIHSYNPEGKRGLWI